MTNIKSIITLLLLVCCTGLSAQRVGMVMSGGGAKGLYHIGVIKALEENGIPIDYVSGTSMGSIIAGLYAIGYSPDQMADIFRSDVVGYWMSGKIPAKYIYYFRHKQPNAAMLSLRLDPTRDKKIAQLPTNLISSYQIDMAFVEFFSAPNALCKGDFSKLFVPFRCIATDAAAQKEVVYRTGNLGKAIRASMTIPLVFRPLKQDSTLLYDGGMYNNFPWQVLKEDFNPDILIGSKCTAGNSKPEEDNVMEQILALTMMHTDYTLPSSNDILIEHAFEDVTTLDFSKVDYIIQRGYEDAMLAMPKIKERITRRVDPDSLAMRRKTYRDGLPNLFFQQYGISGLNENQHAYVQKLMQLDQKGKDGKPSTTPVFNLEQFRSAYFKILSDGAVEGEYPEVRYDDSTRLFDLSVAMRTHPSMKVMFGGNVSSTSMNQAYIGLEYRRIGRHAQTYNLDGYFSALYSSVELRGRTDFFMRSVFSLDYGLNFNYYNYFKSNFGGLTKKTDLTYSKYVDPYATLALRVPVDRYSVFSLRCNAGYDRYSYFQTTDYSDDDQMDRTRFPFLGAKLELDRDGTNYMLYPTRGVKQSFSAFYISGQERYIPGSKAPVDGQERFARGRHWMGVQFERENYFNMAKWFTLGYMVQAVVTDHPSFDNEYATNITSPAFRPTVHSNFVYIKDMRSSSFIGAGLMPVFEFGPKFYLHNSVYLFAPKDRNETKEQIRKRVRFLFSSSLVYQSPVGPISLTLSKYDATNRYNWFMVFNLGFTIFNRNGLFY